MGTVYLRRKNQFARIIGGEKTASGYIEENDLFLFTSSRFTDTFGGEKELVKIFNHKTPHQILDEITPRLKGNNDEGLIALFAQFHKERSVEELSSEEALFISKEKPWEKILNGVQTLYKKTQDSVNQQGKKRTLTFIMVVIVSLILIWSVGFGYKRRTEAGIQKKINSSREIIIKKLDQADEASFLNLSQSLDLISEAKGEVDKLKKEVGEKRKEIGELNKLITERENKITKKEEKNYEEFYDLTIDNKNAQGNKAYLESDQLVIVDNNQGNIYNLSLTKKSLDKKSFKEIKNAQLLASYNNEFIFYTTNGLYKIDSQGNIKKIIDKDNDWGNIVGLWIYNGNLYLLDSRKSEIYKYLVAENGYSAKTSYFKGGESGLKNSNSLAIDSSVYVGFTDHIFKFTAGVQEDFKTSFPETNIAINKIFTNKEVEKVYAWDKTKGSIYVLGKNGTYEREINSSILKQTNDFVVYNNAAYILAGAKILKIGL